MHLRDNENTKAGAMRMTNEYKASRDVWKRCDGLVAVVNGVQQYRLKPVPTVELAVNMDH